MIAILSKFGLVPEAVVVDDYDMYQLPRPADKAINLTAQPEDVKQPFALVFGSVVSEVSELWKIVKRTDMGSDPEYKAQWLVQQVRPDLDNVDKFRSFVMSQDQFRAPYAAAISVALKG
jgi:hypothetical protein